MANSTAKQSTNQLLQQSNNAIEINSQLRNEAAKFGITQANLEQTHPELQAAKSKFNETIKGALKKIIGAATITAVAAAAIPLALHKRIKTSKGVKAVIALLAGGVGASVGGTIAAHSSKDTMANAAIDYMGAENRILAEEINTARAQTTVAAGLQPRNASFAQQATIDTEKKNNTEIAL